MHSQFPIEFSSDVYNLYLGYLYIIQFKIYYYS